MLTHPHRFHGHGSLRYVYKNGRAARSHFFTIKATANPRRRVSRFAVVVSKKVHKRAVVRNRIRRRTYEIIRHTLPSIHDTYDIAIIVSTPEVSTAPYSEIESSFLQLLSQLEVLPPTTSPER